MKILASSYMLEPDEATALEHRARDAGLHLLRVSLLDGPQRVGVIVLALAGDNLLATSTAVTHLLRVQEVVVG